MTVILMAPRCRHCGRRHSSFMGACQPWIRDVLDDLPELKEAFGRLLETVRPALETFQAWADEHPRERSE
jgi:hypothetical protein